MINTIKRQIGFLTSSIKEYGLMWVLRRFLFEAKWKSGYFRWSMPRREWRANELKNWLKGRNASSAEAYHKFFLAKSERHFVQRLSVKELREILSRLLGDAGKAKLVADAEEIRKGVSEYFFYHKKETGFPPKWHHNPFAPYESNPSVHWTEIPIITPEMKEFDIKFIWELSRFAPAYTLSRAYALTGDEVYAESFWQLVEDWAKNNPPNCGANWRCGQEISLRLMAWCFGLFLVRGAECSTAERIFKIVGWIAAQAGRVEKTYEYAILQRNNHATSEGMGLYIVGTLFPELKQAHSWKRRGKMILEMQAREFIKSDGSFRQNSTNYHRLMLHDVFYAMQIAEVNGDHFSDVFIARVNKASEFLAKLVDPDSGRAPRFGGNDGALVFPVNNCDYADYRPIAEAIHYQLKGKRLFELGPWHEDIIWLHGVNPSDYPQEKQWPYGELDAPVGGFYSFNGSESKAFFRCIAEKERPNHADNFHVDLWFDGINFLRDAGSSLYYVQEKHKYGRTFMHNTAVVDGEDQMVKGPRFMWLNWVSSTVHCFERNERFVHFEASHNGYERFADSVRHSRALVCFRDDFWLVIDQFNGNEQHDIEINWHHPGQGHQVDIEGKQVVLEVDQKRMTLRTHIMGDVAKDFQFTHVDGDDSSYPKGFYSDYYGQSQGGSFTSISGSPKLPCRVLTVLSPKGSGNDWLVEGDTIKINGHIVELVPSLESGRIIEKLNP